MSTLVMFGLLSAGSLYAAFKVVSEKDMVRAIFWLAAVLIGTAGLYAVLQAGFLAAIQILLYTGGVITLMLFSVLLARRDGGGVPSGGSTGVVQGALIAGGMLAVVLVGLHRQPLPHEPPTDSLSTAALGARVLDELVVPFELLSVLLLAAMIGAVVLARRKDA